MYEYAGTYKGGTGRAAGDVDYGGAGRAAGDVDFGGAGRAGGDVDLGGTGNLDIMRRGADAMRGDATSAATRNLDADAATQKIKVEIINGFKNNKGVEAVLTYDGKVIKGTFTPEELANFSGKSLDDITKMMDDVEVKNAATLKADDLKRLGIAGSLTAGVVFLMLATGEMNPIKAIEKAVEAAAKKAADIAEGGGNIVSSLLQKMFGSFKGFLGVSAMFISISCVMVILWLIMSVVLKK